LKQKPAGSSAELSDSTATRPVFTADLPGEYVVGLIVSDATLQSAEDSVTIVASDEPIEGNQPPVADAGPNQEGAVGARVTLDASGTTDPDGDELTYFWRFSVKPPAAGALSISDPLTPNASFVPDAEGTYQLLLEVRDADHLATDTVTITVSRLPSSACLLISEYIQGSGTNKAIELYNCGDDAVDLNEFRLCIVSNESTDCEYDIELLEDSFDSIAPGSVATICHTGVDLPALDPAGCDIRHGWLNNLTGDDRFFVYQDTNHSGDYAQVDLIVDAFGQTAVQPSGEIWADQTFRRCNFDFFVGELPFEVTDYFNEYAIDDFSDFGVAPTEGC
jgi:hypothetical protein